MATPTKPRDFEKIEREVSRENSPNSPVVQALQQQTANAFVLYANYKHYHWQTFGPLFRDLHKLFDEVNAAIEDHVDEIAERVVQLGGVAEGTARVAAQRSQLLDYPLTLSTGQQHVAALSDALSEFGRSIRIGIEEMENLGDTDSADLLTQVSRDLDKWLWFVEAHQQGVEEE